MTRPSRFAILAVLLSLSASPSLALTFTVDTTVDLPDASPGDGACAAAGGGCTLRAAVQEANALRPRFDIPSPDTVRLPAGTYELTIPPNPADEEATGDLDVTDVLEIVGDGPAATIIDGNHIDRIIQGGVDGASGTTLVVRGVTFRNGGNASVVGGGIFHSGDLLFEDVVVRDCIADIGGGIYSTGTLIRTVVTGNVADACCAGIRASQSLTIIDSTVSDNHTDGVAGGLFGYGFFTLSVLRSTFSGNSAGTYGGGLYLMGEGTTLVDSTVSGNRAGRDGGGIYRQGAYDAGTGAQQTGRVQLWGCTVANNVADADESGGGNGGGVASQAGGDGIYLRNTILADNVDPGGEAPDCSAVLWSDGHNLVGSMQGCSFSNTPWGDLIGAEARLAPLALNGGLTETHALLPSSSARDWGNPLIPGTGAEACSAKDQRGIPRPQSSRCDIGAYELEIGVCAAPRVDCTPAAARGSSLTLGRSPKRLRWTWKGDSSGPAEFGDPSTGSGYALCVFDAQSGAPVRTLEAVVPGGPCPRRPCWKADEDGVSYRNRARTPSGVQAFQAEVGARGTGGLSVKAAGDALPLPPLPLGPDPELTVQLLSLETGSCWEARFDTSSRNSANTFSAKSN